MRLRRSLRAIERITVYEPREGDVLVFEVAPGRGDMELEAMSELAEQLGAAFAPAKVHLFDGIHFRCVVRDGERHTSDRDPAP